MNLIEEARQFATLAHASIKQIRRYTGEPYIVHPAAVAAIVSSVTDDHEMIAAAWLHDTVEDTPISLIDIEKTFGLGVATLVNQLTKVSSHEDGDRASRRAIDRAFIARGCQRAKTIKLADIIDNTRAIAEHDLEFATLYLHEKELMLEVLTEGHSDLYKQAVATIEASKQAVAAQIASLACSRFNQQMTDKSYQQPHKI